VKSPPLYVYLLALLAMLFWGMSFIWSTIVFEYYDPITTVFLRLVLSTLILKCIIIIWKKKEKIRKEHYSLFMLSALMNPFLYFLGENFGLKLTSPSISAVIIALIPLLTPVAGIWVLKEKLSRMNIAGMIISFTGLIVLLVKPDMTMRASPAGVALLAFAVVVAIVYSVLLKRLTAHYSAMTIIAVQNFIGVLYFLPLFLIFGFSEFISIVPSARLVYSMLQLAFFASTVAYVLYTITTRHLGISRTNIFTNLIPVFTAVFSWFILGELFDLPKIIGMLIVLAGVALSQYKGNMAVSGVYRFIFYNKRKNN